MRTCILLACALVCGGQTYDLVLRGGRVIDPKNSIDGPRDIAVREGKIAAVEPSIDPSQAKKTIDVRGLVVVPGLIDIHVHLFHTTGQKDAWAGDNSVAPDGFSFRSCTTTMVDAGSAGWRNFETFRHTVIDRVQTRVYAMINIAGLGMMTNAAEQVPSEFQPNEVIRLARKHSDVVVGVKTAHYERPDWLSVDRAVEAGRGAGIPVMVDFGYFLAGRPYHELVLNHLRSGDISTHFYRSAVPILNDQGKLYGYLNDARARGVKFDVGHGGGSLVFRNAAPAVAQGFYPDSISTDLHVTSMNAGMMDMVTTMSKFLVMGMPLGEVVLRSTWNPARILHREQHGHLTPGAAADIAVLRVAAGDFAYVDSSGGRLAAKQRMFCEVTVREGRVVWDWNGRAAVDYKLLGPSYGLREGGADVMTRPPR
jgi:dihydroorotase